MAKKRATEVLITAMLEDAIELLSLQLAAHQVLITDYRGTATNDGRIAAAAQKLAASCRACLNRIERSGAGAGTQRDPVLMDLWARITVLRADLRIASARMMEVLQDAVAADPTDRFACGVLAIEREIRRALNNVDPWQHRFPKRPTPVVLEKFAQIRLAMHTRREAELAKLRGATA